jgi:hypothetical protein
MSGTRVTTIGGALLLLAGIYTLPSDLRNAAADLVDAVASNTVGAGLVLLGVMVIVAANWTSIRYWTGFGRGNRRWISDIELWFRDHRRFVPRNKEFIREWPGDGILPRTGFVLTLAEQMKGADGNILERHVTFARNPGGSFILIRMGLRPSPEHVALLRAGPAEFREDLVNDLVIALGSLPVEFESEADDERLWRFKVSWAVPVGSRLTELELVGQVHAVLRAREVINHKILVSARQCARALGRQLPLEEPVSDDEGNASQQSDLDT